MLNEKFSSPKAAIAVCAAAGLAAACYSGLIVRHYTIKTRKLAVPVSLALISDLHGCYYGKNQCRLIAKIYGQNPDAIVMTGDILDERMPVRGVIDFLKGVQGRYPCYYATGNHEYRTRRLQKVKDLFASYGVEVLDGIRKELDTGGGSISICGVDDFEAGAGRFRRQLQNAFRGKDRELYTVLLSHRPEKIAAYAKSGCDLVLCGHAHGGQWRIPYILNGLYAPEQGFFPKYAGGEYEYGETRMVVSRGLARESSPFIPRIFNPPELVIIDIIPDNQFLSGGQSLKPGRDIE